MKFNKLMASLAAGVMALSMAGTNVFAAQNYTPVTGDNTHGFAKYLIVDADAKTPAIEFDFTIAPGTAQAADNGQMAVLAGVGTPTIIGSNGTTTNNEGKAIFSEGETTSTTAETGMTLDTGRAFAKREMKFGFATVSFPEPGVYRYVITETSAGQQAISYDTQAATPGAKVRYLDVYVVDNAGALEVSAYILHETDAAVPAGTDMGSAYAGDAVADKSTGFVNEYDTSDVEFGKETTGNQASKDKYFAVSIAIGNAAHNATYVVDIAGADATSGSNSATIAANAGQANVTSITTDAQGAATQTFYLNDGQYIRVKGLPKDATYNVTENAEDYKSTPTIATTVAEFGGHAHTDAVQGTIVSADIFTGYVNTRNGVIPTGVATAAAGALGLVALGAIGLASKRRKEED